MINKDIKRYCELVKQGDIVRAYNTILKFMGELGSYFNESNSEWKVGSLYHGYMDMTYFSVVNNNLREKHLKVAVVYLHDKNQFEIWLSAKNRNYIKSYKADIDNFCRMEKSDINIFHDKANADAIIEYVALENPDFESKERLKKALLNSTELFLKTIEENFQI